MGLTHGRIGIYSRHPTPTERKVHNTCLKLIYPESERWYTWKGCRDDYHFCNTTEFWSASRGDSNLNIRLLCVKKIFHLSRPCWIFVHSEATGEVRVKPTPWKALARHDVSRCFVGRVIDLKGTWHPVWSFGRLDGIVRFSYRLYWSLFRSISLCFKFVKVFPAEKSVHKGRDSFCAWPAFWRATSWRLACKTVLWTRRISLWWQILRSSPNSGTARVGHG